MRGPDTAEKAKARGKEEAKRMAALFEAQRQEEQEREKKRPDNTGLVLTIISALAGGTLLMK